MKQEPKSGKRIVSKSAYAANMSKKAALSSYGASVFLLGIISTVLTVVGAIWLLIRVASHPSLEGLWGFLLGAGMFGGCSAGLLYFGKAAIVEAKETDAGVPLTRANTGHLPEPDSLVRATQEPVQAQEGVLLRAAVGETHPQDKEHLLRAAHE